MAQKSKIEWTQATWNPVTGCTEISIGCKNCYARRMAMRLKAMGQPNYANGFCVTLQPHALEIPLHWKEPRTVFVNSMSDLFHEEIPLDYILEVFGIMRQSRQHRYQVLTKRSQRLLQFNPKLPWLENIWMGVTVESSDYIFRIDHLRQTNATTKFLSIEPLLGPIKNLNLGGIDWVIVGGESGPGARFMQPEWATDIRDQCLAANVPFFFKQWGGVNKKKNGRILDDRTWDEMPRKLELQEPSYV